MNVHSGLAACFPDVYTDVVTIGRVLFIHYLFGLIQQFQDGILFSGGHVEKIGNMPLRYGKHMPFAEGTIVVPHEGKLIFNHNVFCCRAPKY